MKTILLAVALALTASAANAAGTWKCGNVYQDHPCSVERQEQGKMKGLTDNAMKTDVEMVLENQRRANEARAREEARQEAAYQKELAERQKENQRERNRKSAEEEKERAKAQQICEKHGGVWRRASLGMTSRVATLCLGNPKKVNRSTGAWGVHEQWVYDSGAYSYLYFENGILTSTQN